MAVCKFCTKEITWTKEGRKNVPVEFDGAIHKCDEMINSLSSIKKIEPTSLSAEEIKKYEMAINERASKKKKKK